MNSPTNQPAAAAPREDTSPKDATVPMWLIVVCFLLVFWGAVYFDEHGGWFESQVYTPYVSAEQLKDYQVSGGPNPFELGRAVYNRPTCVVCHQANGQGQAGTFPPLAGSDWVNDKDPSRMIRIVLQGFSGPGLKVNGQPFNTGSAMIAWNALTDDEIAAVITYVRGNAEWGNKASPVTPEQVRAIREKVKAHLQPFTPAEIEAMPPGQ
jgi:mono/diheme cytochrome c family protein